MQPAGFGCPCHGGAYDTEGNRTAGPPVRSLDRYAFSIVDGNLVLGKHFSVGTVDGTGADAVIDALPAGLPGRPRRRHRALALSPTGAGVLTMAKSARRAQIEKAALYPLDWVEERSGLVGVHEVVPLPQRPARRQLDADARRGDADGVPRPGDDGRAGARHSREGGRAGALVAVVPRPSRRDRTR